MFKSFLRNQTASVAIMFALTSPVLLMSAAMAVDVGTFYLQKRALQGATDLAAVAAAQNPNIALKAAQQNLAVNGFDPGAVQNVQFGDYVPNASEPPAQWFSPNPVGEAIQVSTQIQARLYFASILNLASASGGRASSATITATATAARNPEAAFTVASGLANLNGGVLNTLLGRMLGANLTFSLMDYQSLASANVSLFAFSNALATRMNLTNVTYSQLAAMTVSTPVALAALADAADATAGVSATVATDLQTFSNAAANASVNVGQLMAFADPSVGNLQVTSSGPFAANANALDMVSAIAQLANGQNQVAASLSVNQPPIASATLALAIGQPPVGSGYVTIGSAGATIHTAQTRLLLTLQLAEAGSTSVINLPIYLELASATATLSSVSCATDPTQNSATLAVTPALVNAWIGTVSSANMTNFSTEPSPSPATLLTLPGLLTVQGRANAQIDNMSPTSVTFSASDISAAVRKTTSTTDFAASLISNLFASLQLSANVAGVTVSVPPGASSAIGATLASAAAPIDQTLSQIFDALGLSLGNAYTYVNGIKCSSAKLVL